MPDATFTVPRTDGAPITCYRWDPPSEPVAAVQLVHGMGEHLLRYAELAAALTAAGMVVYGHDHRGHGASIAPGAEPGALGPNGWALLVADIHVLTTVVRERHPGLPVGLVAHSMGSFAAQQYLLEHSDAVDAVVLSGTTVLDQLEPAFDLDKPIDLAVLNAPFEPARTPFDWLSRDEAQVDAYLADPLCGFGLDSAAGKDMFAGARRLADPQALANVRADLPVYLVAGELDPVNGQGALVELLASRLRDAGVKDVEARIYPGARHEIFNETNRAEVVADVVARLRRALG